MASLMALSFYWELDNSTMCKYQIDEYCILSLILLLCKNLYYFSAFTIISLCLIAYIFTTWITAYYGAFNVSFDINN